MSAALVRAQPGLALALALSVIVASLALAPLYADASWLRSLAVAVSVTAAAAALARLARVPLLLVPAVATWALLSALAVMFVPDATALGWFAGPVAIGELAGLAREGVAVVQAVPAPAQVVPPLALLSAGGAGLLLVCADTAWAAARAPAVAAIGVLAMALPASFMLPDGAPWWSFLPPALAFTGLLALDQRERVRALDARLRGPGTAARALGAAGLLAAIALAAVLPVRGVVPWFPGNGTGDGEAIATGPVTVDPVVQMRRGIVDTSDREVLRYRTTGDPTYLRVAVLEEYDGLAWRPSWRLFESGFPIPGELPGTPEPSGERVSIEVTDLASPFLPMPAPVSAVEGDRIGDGWRLDPRTGTAFSGAIPASGRAYDAVLARDSVSVAALRAAGSALDPSVDDLLALPELDPSIAALAAEVTAGAGGPYGRALALQRWFARDGGFTYSLGAAPGTQADYLAAFLRDRVGYCEQFAGAMAVMARTLGIPSRVAIGFTQGELDERTGEWRVAARDSHAWPELWFEGAGWVRFEPTPSGTGNVQAPQYAPADAAAGERADAASQAPAQDARAAERAEAAERADAASTGAPAPDPSRTAIAALAVVAGLAVIALAWPGASRALARRRRLSARSRRALLEGAWAEVRATAIDAGERWPATATVREQEAVAGRWLGTAGREALRRLRAELESARYGRPGPDVLARETADAIVADVRAVRSALLGRLGAMRRIGTYAWPSSWRLRQRSSIRSMNPDERGAGPAGPRSGAAGASGASASAATTGRVKAE